jgi:hypothetical protein
MRRSGAAVGGAIRLSTVPGRDRKTPYFCNANNGEVYAVSHGTSSHDPEQGAMLFIATLVPAARAAS